MIGELNSAHFNDNKAVFFLHDLIDRFDMYHRYVVCIEFKDSEKPPRTHEDVEDVAFNYNMMVVKCFSKETGQQLHYYRLDDISNWTAIVKEETE